MATAVKSLDGAEGYLRWKESVLLRLRTVRVAHVLSEDPPAGGEIAPAAKQWAHDDALCRGHILATLSNRLFPDYVRHATARSLWDAVARTYDVDMASHATYRRFSDFQFDEGASLLEQIAHAEALAADIKPPLTDDFVAHEICGKHHTLLPMTIRDDLSMTLVWEVARRLERTRISHDDDEREQF
uniref:Uncharacterized protein n=1 Tax=Avena sativa TaxID=4498 RepID=A0ACD6A1B4_AVESA